MVKGFLEKEENRKLYAKALVEPTEENKKLVEEAFSQYYDEIRKLSYFSNMIKFMSIDYDKRVRKYSNRFSLTLDQPLQTDNGETTLMKDIIPDPSPSNLYEGEETLTSQIANDNLKNALENLTEKQIAIIEMKYVKLLSNIEIAKIINSTPQNVSNILNKTLKKLKKQMKVG
ncbi:sigma-70 family RNA polymerase sigma factor [Bacillus circulans]|uniref:sigma-70 family RNA polymerase sigma factor n=1 Tax=Niallia circulans TaxID=1397 RepID=UPI0002DD2111|nr:sigma-70 family RNA polymerase sigma factor [Niallia circulans]NRG29779.1 sigma-70 family RNA polymerase sigma factor [Niallia circulans]